MFKAADQRIAEKDANIQALEAELACSEMERIYCGDNYLSSPHETTHTQVHEVT